VQPQQSDLSVQQSSDAKSSSQAVHHGSFLLPDPQFDSINQIHILCRIAPDSVFSGRPVGVPSAAGPLHGLRAWNHILCRIAPDSVFSGRPVGVPSAAGPLHGLRAWNHILCRIAPDPVFSGRPVGVPSAAGPLDGLRNDANVTLPGTGTGPARFAYSSLPARTAHAYDVPSTHIRRPSYVRTSCVSTYPEGDRPPPYICLRSYFCRSTFRPIKNLKRNFSGESIPQKNRQF
jgi:hypothetical protein